ncbi:MAG: hypothetical protein KAS80_05535 [Anaerolineales bacterium]|nr:hypothetical protein [Anaerolineales bacterium]
MSGLTFILAVVVIAVGFIWVRTSGSLGLVRNPVRITVRIDEEPPVRRIPVEIRSNSPWR